MSDYLFNKPLATVGEVLTIQPNANHLSHIQVHGDTSVFIRLAAGAGKFNKANSGNDLYGVLTLDEAKEARDALTKSIEFIEEQVAKPLTVQDVINQYEVGTIIRFNSESTTYLVEHHDPKDAKRNRRLISTSDGYQLSWLMKHKASTWIITTVYPTKGA